ncbi:MAG: rRNA pseudouridine synthase [Anaerolineae bacterium]|nr:MAG: rRNA pseudouridine synthase [Anaerolineae bacterium]
MAVERIQKLLAQAGHGSRRECETFIEAGRVKVNGKVAKLGDKADLAVDDVRLDGRVLAQTEPLEYILLNKPRYVLTAAKSEEGRRTVLDLVETTARVYPVGRLDLESEGLVLLTNDGDLANRLTHPRYGHEKEYRVLLAKRPDAKQLTAWQRGVVLEDGHTTLPAEVRVERNQGKGAVVRVVMTEGRKRQIREICGQLGLPVVRLTRVRLHTLRLGGLQAGKWRHLSLQEVAELKGEKPAPTKAATGTGKPRPRKTLGESKNRPRRTTPRIGKVKESLTSRKRTEPGKPRQK